MSIAPISTPPTPAAPASPAARRACALLFVVIAVGSLAGLAVALWWPVGSEEGFTSNLLQLDRGLVWTFLTLAGINLVLGVCALAVAGWLLAPARGNVWATVGVSVMWLGAALYGVGIGNWAGMFHVATDTMVLDVGTAAALLDVIEADALRLWALPGAGAGLVALGTVVLSVGLWRARTLPRWVPAVAAVSILATFVLPTSGPAGLFVEGPVAASSIAIGWYAWRRTASHLSFRTSRR